MGLAAEAGQGANLAQPSSGRMGARPAGDCARALLVRQRARPPCERLLALQLLVHSCGCYSYSGAEARQHQQANTHTLSLSLCLSHTRTYAGRTAYSTASRHSIPAAHCVPSIVVEFRD